MKKDKKIITVMILCFITAGLFFALSIDKEESDYVTNLSSDFVGTSVGAEEATSSSGVCVYVVGAVNSPGVYYLEAGSRITDAIEAAGGFTDDADRESLNLADVISDGQKIVVMTEVEKAAEVASISEAALGLVNINTAGEAELQTLPGIGSSRAKAIIEYRNTSGPFAQKTDIMNVSGIKEASYEKIKDLIKVE